MRRVIGAACLLILSGYIWPTLYKQSSNINSFLLFMLVGFGFVAVLGWLVPRIEAIGITKLGGKQLGLLALWSLPVAASEVALAVTYWAYIGGGPPPGLGALAMLPPAALAVWALADAAIRGLCEEGVFRGMLQPALLKRYESYAGSGLIAIAITTFWFLVAHLYGLADYRLLPYLAFLSVCYGYLAVKTGRFLSSAVLHMLHNVVATFVAAYLVVPTHLAIFDDRGIRGLLLLIGLIGVNFVAILVLARRWLETAPVGPATSTNSTARQGSAQ